MDNEQLMFILIFHNNIGIFFKNIEYLINKVNNWQIL